MVPVFVTQWADFNNEPFEYIILHETVTDVLLLTWNNHLIKRCLWGYIGPHQWTRDAPIEDVLAMLEDTLPLYDHHPEFKEILWTYKISLLLHAESI